MSMIIKSLCLYELYLNPALSDFDYSITVENVFLENHIRG